MQKSLIVLALLGACSSENNIFDSNPAVGVPNIRPVPQTTQEDKLVQVQVPEVDILWIIDNSCSMFEEQSALSQNFPIFMDYFLGSGLDYHIGSVSTDMFKNSESGKLQGSQGYLYIDEATVNPTQVFQGMAVLGTGGSATETGRDAGYAAIEVHGGAGGFNEGYYREQASLHFVAISDEEDQSSQIGLSEFIDWFSTLKITDDMVSFSSIVSPRPTCPTASTPGDNYNAVTQAVGGISWSICNTDGWADVLEQLGIQASGLKREYFLSDLPVPGSITVKVVEAGVTYTFEEDVDWTYDSVRNSIVFLEFVPSALSEVFVDYDLISAKDNNL